MTHIEKITPTIYQPQWLQTSHVAFSPEVQQQVRQHLGKQQALVGQSRFGAAWHAGQINTSHVLAKAFRASDAVFGNASPTRCGVLGHVGHGLAFAASAIVSAPVWLSFNIAVGTYVFNRIRDLLLLPVSPVCMVSALVGLALKAAAFLVFTPTVTLGSFLRYAVRPGKAELSTLPPPVPVKQTDVRRHEAARPAAKPV